MRLPWWWSNTSPNTSPEKPKDEKPSPSTGKWNELAEKNLELLTGRRYPDFKQRLGGLDPISLAIGSVVTILCARFYKYQRRIPNAAWVTPDILNGKRWIRGVVTRLAFSSILYVSLTSYV